MHEVPKPRITLLDWPQHPIQTIYAMAQNMRGNMLHDVSGISIEEAWDTLKEFDPGVTRLGGVLEFCKFVFQVENVPRAFTHQLVRHRTSSFSQESLRFTLREGGKFSYDIGPTVVTEEQLEIFSQVMDVIGQGYAKLVDLEVATQDARGVLPINTLTKIGFQIDLRALIAVAEVRLCHQSQDHWVEVMKQIKSEIIEKVPGGDLLAGLLVKACDRSGKCEFQSTWDRPCPVQIALRNKVCANCDMLFRGVCKGWKHNKPCKAMIYFMGTHKLDGKEMVAEPGTTATTINQYD